ncbi:MAG: tetratricopeptide repeat protein [Candidatus Tectimicrobiota bacterium]
MAFLLAQARQCQRQGHLPQAAHLYEAILQQQPQHAEALHDLGVLRGQQGDMPQALVLLRQAVSQAGHRPDFHYNLGTVLLRQGEHAAAVAAYETALQLDPHLLQAWQNLGVAQQALGHLEAAALAYQAIIRQRPDYAAAYNNLGTIKRSQGDLTAAQEAYSTAIRLQTDFAEAYTNLGIVYQSQHRIDAARAAFDTAIRLRPAYAEAHLNRGAALQADGDLEAALDAYDTVLRLQPQCARAHWNRALIWLAQGNLAAGWPAYEWRLQLPDAAPARFPYPRWQGAALQHSTILVQADQGVGDEILFVSCLPSLLEQARHVVLECDPRLQTLLARSFPGATVYGRTPVATESGVYQGPPVQVQIPASSLPLYLRPTLADFPAQAAFLRPDAARQQQYQQRLAALGPGLKVGIAWRSIASRRQDPTYTQLAQWETVLTIPGVHFVTLQYDDTAKELEAARQRWGVSLHDWGDLDLLNDFEGVAALMSALDLVLAPESTVAALAGALGQPVWRLSVAGSSWTSLGTAGCPWFPSMRLLCQSRRGVWEDVLQQVAADLHLLAQAPTSIVDHRRA